jgi:hypothetical protein
VPIVVTLFGIVTLAKTEQFANAFVPILVTLFGIVTDVIRILKLKALSPILLYPCIITDLADPILAFTIA